MYYIMSKKRSIMRIRIRDGYDVHVVLEGVINSQTSFVSDI